MTPDDVERLRGGRAMEAEDLARRTRYHPEGLPRPTMGHLPRHSCGAWFTDPEEFVMVCRGCGQRREFKDGYWADVAPGSEGDSPR